MQKLLRRFVAPMLLAVTLGAFPPHWALLDQPRFGAVAGGVAYFLGIPYFWNPVEAWKVRPGAGRPLGAGKEGESYSGDGYTEIGIGGF